MRSLSASTHKSVLEPKFVLGFFSSAYVSAMAVNVAISGATMSTVTVIDP